MEHHQLGLSPALNMLREPADATAFGNRLGITVVVAPDHAKILAYRTISVKHYQLSAFCPDMRSDAARPVRVRPRLLGHPRFDSVGNNVSGFGHRVCLVDAQVLKAVEHINIESKADMKAISSFVLTHSCGCRRISALPRGDASLRCELISEAISRQQF